MTTTEATRPETQHAPENPEPPVLVIGSRILAEIHASIGQLRAESGGALGGNGNPNRADVFHFDESSRNSSVTYSPDYQLLNRLFKEQWNPRETRLRGFVHSHPGPMNRPSYGDEVYAERILAAIDDLPVLWLPIVNTLPDTGQFTLTPWAVYRADRGVSVVKGRVRVAREAIAQPQSDGEVPEIEALLGRELDAIVLPGRREAGQTVGTVVQGAGAERRDAKTKDTSRSAVAEPDPSPRTERPSEQASTEAEAASGHTRRIGQTFVRVRGAYDLEVMFRSRVIAVGAGGAADFLETLARAGLGQFVLIDPDIVSETNLATQQTYRRDIGRPKVDCVAERIRDINPDSIAIALNKSLDDLDDVALKELAVGPINGRTPDRTVICGLTDSFEAQARVNRLALHLGLPSLCAQVYREGRGAEITFTYPGVTPACHRCILSSRYRYYLEQGLANDVTSDGTPIFATTRLNAIKGFVMLALLHHGNDHPRWGSLLTRIGKRNLIQLRMDPDFTETMGMTVFDRVFGGGDQSRILFDEVVWLPQDQECPEAGYAYHCPDCGGTGDLRNTIGSCGDTRVIPRVGQAVSPAVAN